MDEHDLAQITQASRRRGLISQDETAEAGRLSTYRQTNRPHPWQTPARPSTTYTHSTAQLTVRKNPQR